MPGSCDFCRWETLQNRSCSSHPGFVPLSHLTQGNLSPFPQPELFQYLILVYNLSTYTQSAVHTEGSQ